MRKLKQWINLSNNTSFMHTLLFRNAWKAGVAPVYFMQARGLNTTKFVASNALCTFRNGYVVLTVPLPSRQENCEFFLRPVSHTVKNFVSFVQDEDGGVDRIALYSMEGNKISNSTPIDILLQSDFKIGLNDKTYHIESPKVDILVTGSKNPLSNTKNLISQLYTDLGVQEYKDRRQQQICEQLGQLNNELAPLEERKALIDAKAAQRTNTVVWAGLGYMALQFGFLARLTWWEYSWDIMEPVTYFVTYSGAMVCYAYFVLTREDNNCPEVRNRLHLLSFYKASAQQKFDVASYNAKKDTIARLEHELKLLKSPPSFAELNTAVKKQSL